MTNILNKILLRLIIGAFPLLLLGGCQFYHDTAAHYNAYFLANEKLKEVEQAFFENIQNDYNDVLFVFDEIDSTRTNAQKEGMEYIIKKASLPIKWHKGSKWIDDCYNLIARSRLYQEDYDNALDTYKYVYANSEDPAEVHEALIWMLRLFIEKDEPRNMEVVKQAINDDTRPFNKENTKMYHLTMAHYYRLERNFAPAAEHLHLAAPLEEDKNRRARYFFILGQLYRQLNDNEKAYDYFHTVSKINTSYDLEFVAALNAKAVQPQELSNPEISEELDKYFQKSLKDLKNWDYRDRIYYEMAKVELKRPDLDQALTYLNESIQLSTKDQIQKGYSYLLTGQLYYTEKTNYVKSAAYYDSAIQTLPKTIPDYEQVATRADYLKDLAKFTSIIEEKDRLLKLSQMSPEEQQSIFEQEITSEKESIIQQQEYDKINEGRRNLKMVTSELPSTKGGNSWYFYNATASVAGSSAFLRTWGSRPLEDNWRRSRKQKVETNNLKEALAQDEQQRKAAEEDVFASVKSVEQRQAEIPTSPEDIQQIRNELEEALFSLMKVYIYKIKSYPDAEQICQRLINEFDKGVYTPEAVYIFYTLCKDQNCDQEIYKNVLLEQHPESFYAKIIINPQYVSQNNLMNRAAEKNYERAYRLYKSGNYENAQRLIEETLVRYPTNGLKDKFQMLEVLIVGQTAIFFKEYHQAISDFIEKNPESELMPIANSLLEQVDTNALDKRIPGRYHYERQ
ncbi:hypothetical protein V6R21_25580 [Limibacter armeniacum]|uniref:type IX secretion system periplasmic lipoprotein PorW/SprE n=1 Tax=Limibacter armeniacum TaxID=466084 RepID=UPI002FE57199